MGMNALRSLATAVACVWDENNCRVWSEILVERQMWPSSSQAGASQGSPPVLQSNEQQPCDLFPSHTPHAGDVGAHAAKEATELLAHT